MKIRNPSLFKQETRPPGPSPYPAFSYRPTYLHLPSATWYLVCHTARYYFIFFWQLAATRASRDTSQTGFYCRTGCPNSNRNCQTCGVLGPVQTTKNYLKYFLKPKTKSRNKEQLSLISQIAEISIKDPDTSGLFFQFLKMPLYIFHSSGIFSGSSVKQPGFQ